MFPCLSYAINRAGRQKRFPSMTSAMTPAPIIIVAIRVILLIEAVIAALAQSWPQLLIALATLGLTFLPDRAAPVTEPRTSVPAGSSTRPSTLTSSARRATTTSPTAFVAEE